MIVIPAIDLKDGKCVRLEQGLMERDTVYSDDPAATARRWQEEGGELLHIVDLDGAFAGVPKNRAAIEAIVAEVLAASATQVEQYRGGNDKVFGFFVGQVMKASKGKANPALVNELLKKKLGV